MSWTKIVVLKLRRPEPLGTGRQKRLCLEKVHEEIIYPPVPLHTAFQRKVLGIILWTNVFGCLLGFMLESVGQGDTYTLYLSSIFE